MFFNPLRFFQDPRELEAEVILRAVVDAVCSQHAKVSAVGEQMLKHVVDVLVSVAASADNALSSYIIGTLMVTAATHCYAREGYAKSGACKAIASLAPRLSVSQTQTISRTLLKV